MRNEITHVNRPSQGDTLYKALFQGRTDESSLETISSGILACCTNAQRLFEDAKILTNADCFATAHFLLATADEEVGKVYILLDMLRLDFAKHEGELRKLCRAFYDHLSKHAYIDILRFPGIWNWYLHGVKGSFDSERRKYWEGNPESGEPDMPADHLMVREGSLYVEFYSDYSQDVWWTPNNNHSKEMVLGSGPNKIFEGALTRVEKSVAKLEESRDNGLFSPECLQIFHEEFSKVFITSPNTRGEKILDLYNHIFGKLEKKGIQLSTTLRADNALIAWPLYSLL